MEMDVSYIKKSKDKQYHLVYFLTNEDLAYFTDEKVKDGSLKNFVQNISYFSLSYEIKTDYT